MKYQTTLGFCLIAGSIGFICGFVGITLFESIILIIMLCAGIYLVNKKRGKNEKHY